MKILLDTNLFVAAYFNKRSHSAKIIDLCIQGQFEAVFSTQIMREIYHIMGNIKANEAHMARIDTLIDQGITIKSPKEVKVVYEDYSDNKFIGCALTAGADYIITSDIHLLKVKNYEQIKIRKPSEFLKEVS